MPYYRTLGHLIKRSPIRILLVALVKVRVATKRSSFVESRLPRMVSCTSRWTLVALTSRILPSLQQRLILCSAGIKMQRNATHISRMYQHLVTRQIFRQTRAHRKRLFRRADGLLEDGRFKNLLL